MYRGMLKANFLGKIKHVAVWRCFKYGTEIESCGQLTHLATITAPRSTSYSVLRRYSVGDEQRSYEHFTWIMHSQIA